MFCLIEIRLKLIGPGVRSKDTLRPFKRRTNGAWGNSTSCSCTQFVVSHVVAYRLQQQYATIISPTSNKQSVELDWSFSATVSVYFFQMYFILMVCGRSSIFSFFLSFFLSFPQTDLTAPPEPSARKVVPLLLLLLLGYKHRAALCPRCAPHRSLIQQTAARSNGPKTRSNTSSSSARGRCLASPPGWR